MINTSGRMHMSSHLVISASARHVHGKVIQAAGEQLESSWRKNLVVIWRSLFDRTPYRGRHFREYDILFR